MHRKAFRSEPVYSSVSYSKFSTPSALLFPYVSVSHWKKKKMVRTFLNVFISVQILTVESLMAIWVMCFRRHTHLQMTATDA